MNTSLVNVDGLSGNAGTFGGTNKRATALQFNPPGTTKDTLENTPEELREGGVASLFNPYAVVAFPYGTGDSWRNRIFDGVMGDKVRGDENFTSMKSKKFTIKDLVDDQQMAKTMPYRYTDFIFCKWLRKIPLNRTIVLRRYAAPTFDNLTVPTKKGSGEVFFKPIAQAVTFFGEGTGNMLSELMSFTTSINWKNAESEVNKVMGNEQDGSEQRILGNMAKLIGILNGNVNSPAETAAQFIDPYEGGPYAHKIWGPVNVIKSAYMRDRGIDFKQQFNLTFEYELRSVGTINPKAAALDLIGNLLAIVHNNAAFWGGANRYFPAKPMYPFLGGKEGQSAWYRGDAAGYSKAVQESFSTAGSSVKGFFEGLMKNPVGALKDLASGGLGLGMMQMAQGRAPSVLQFKALLTGEPVGEWHMVVGNPYEPIMMVGNLIVTDAKFSFNDVLGQDDFPTELKMVVTLEHGRPRDKGDIESMFNKGNGRIYYAYKKGTEPWNTASSTKTSNNNTPDNNPVYEDYTNQALSNFANNVPINDTTSQNKNNPKANTNPNKTKKTGSNKQSTKGNGTGSDKSSDFSSKLKEAKEATVEGAKNAYGIAEKKAHELASKFSTWNFLGKEK